jgi:hypothetical protein
MRFGHSYPKIKIAPLFDGVEDKPLNLMEEE